MNSHLKNWLIAARLRTLPLALSSISMGIFLAIKDGFFNTYIAVSCVLTTVFLQVLSNFSNDYGDSVHGADSLERTGPKRAVQTGAITPKAMKKAMYLMAFLSLISGLWLLYVSLWSNKTALIILLVVGILAILAAIAYTNGKKPYGYAGLGDISVYIFFGLVGVIGTYYLFAQTWYWQLLLPASSCGLLATGVLNINNIRDIESDKKAGKLSIPVRLGAKKARIYHFFLLFFSVTAVIFYVLLQENYNYWNWLFLISVPLLFINVKSVWQKQKAQELDPYLKQLALSTLLFVLSFGVGIMLSN
jgi:1,4-dihydroxy-2-naphthoate octaprenyltransferase